MTTLPISETRPAERPTEHPHIVRLQSERGATAMLRGTRFGRVTAWAGILSNAFMLGLLVILAVAPGTGPVLPAMGYGQQQVSDEVLAEARQRRLDPRKHPLFTDNGERIKHSKSGGLSGAHDRARALRPS